MAYIKGSSILSDVVQKHVSIVPMLNRFGIRLGLGEATVQQVCEERGIDVSFFLHILNSYLDPDFLGEVQLSPQHAVLIADYLEKTNAYYLYGQLPNIEVHLHSFVKRSNRDNPAIQSVPLVLRELKESLAERVKVDETHLLPHFRALAEELGDRLSELTLEHSSNPLGNEEEEEEDRSEALLSDVMQVLIRHISGDFDDNLLYGLLYSLLTLKDDLASNNSLRRRVFTPMLRTMERAKRQFTD